MSTVTPHRNLGSIVLWGGAATLLCIPAIAMQFTNEVNWTASDFLTVAVLLGTVGGAYEFLARRSTGFAYRAGAGIALFTALFLIWVNLAVGIIGSENNDANMMYAGVLATAVGGSMLARFRADGMMRAMLATAAAQVLVAAIAHAFQLGTDGDAWPRDVIGVTAIVTTMWLASAALFSRARERLGRAA